MIVIITIFFRLAVSVKSFSVQCSHLKNVIISSANNISNVIASLQEKNPATHEVNLATTEHAPC